MDRFFNKKNTIETSHSRNRNCSYPRQRLTPRRAFSGKIYELLEFAKILYISFRLQRDSSWVARRRARERFAPSSSAVDDADDTRERVPASIFNIAPTVDFRSSSWRGGSCESRASVTARDVIGDSPVAASISMWMYLLKCNKLDQNQISI